MAVDISDDGSIAIVSSIYHTNSRGAAYIYERSGSTWSETEKLTASDAANGDWFGWSVSISGTNAVVGAMQDNTFRGAAYVFNEDEGGAGNWGEVTKITASDAAVNDLFGMSATIRGERIIVGAGGHDSIAGAIYLFDRDEGGADNWGQLGDPITASDEATGDDFGWFAEIDGDRAVISAQLNDDGGTDSGSAYVFDGVCPCPWDLDSSTQVDILDLLDLLGQWGDDPAPADFDDDGDVDTSDLLALFANWYNCPCIEGPQPLSFEDELDDACISEDDWDDYEDIMQTGTEEEKDNYDCWMRHYIEECDRCTCLGSSGCPGEDPFD